MNVSTQISKHLKEVYFGDNWTYSNLQQHIKDVTWKEAIHTIEGINSIATLVYHMNYYVQEVTKVFEGNELKASDKLSFTHPPIKSQTDWDQFLETVFADALHFADLIDKFPSKKLTEDIAAPKYGSYYRNLHGIIEHLHYHLGQIVILKKIIRQNENN